MCGFFQYFCAFMVFQDDLGLYIFSTNSRINHFSMFLFLFLFQFWPRSFFEEWYLLKKQAFDVPTPEELIQKP
jgi:hypothetical protein